MAIAPFITQNWRRQQLFRTFNHRARPVMRHAVNQVLAPVGIEGAVPEKGWLDFADHACQPLQAPVEWLLGELRTRPFEQSSDLHGKTVAMQNYFAAWQAALGRVGIPTLVPEVRVQAKDPVLVRPVLQAGARVLGLDTTSFMS